MRVNRLWLSDFRNFARTDLSPSPEGLTAIVGDNGQGKTNLLEAVAYLATLESFRGASREALVRTGSPRAVIRAEGDRNGRSLLLEVDISMSRKDRAQVNRQPLRRARDLLGALRVTVFAPDDLRLVTDGPAGRRQLLDAAFVSLQPHHDALRLDLERVLRQRASLLRQAAGRLGPDLERTLEVFDERMVSIAEPIVMARESLLDDLGPQVAAAHAALAPGDGEVSLGYRRSWEGSLEKALADARQMDLRRATTSVGPHRDDLDIRVGGRPTRTHCSRGEQRTVALSLRLGTHRLVTSRVNSPPVLLLDDVFSELDPRRSSALLEHLPPGQALLTAAGSLPAGAEPAMVLKIDHGQLR